MTICVPAIGRIPTDPLITSSVMWELPMTFNQWRGIGLVTRRARKYIFVVYITHGRITKVFVSEINFVQGS